MMQHLAAQRAIAAKMSLWINFVFNAGCPNGECGLAFQRIAVRQTRDPRCARRPLGTYHGPGGFSSRASAGSSLAPARQLLAGVMVRMVSAMTCRGRCVVASPGPSSALATA